VVLNRFGHQSEVMGLCAYTKESCISVGVDKTVRVWKVVEETQLIFRGHNESIDSVAILGEEGYITGSQDGSIAFWTTSKKRPISTISSCHTEGAVLSWITAVGALPNSDLAASGMVKICYTPLCYDVGLYQTILGSQLESV
jgi:ribosomal RNA-processing protein 9